MVLRHEEHSRLWYYIACVPTYTYVNDVVQCLKYSELLLFADDAKIFKEISSYSDCLLLQTDIDNFVQWCTTWGMQLHNDKCYFMNFTLKKSLNVTFNYMMESS